MTNSNLNADNSATFQGPAQIILANGATADNGGVPEADRFNKKSTSSWITYDGILNYFFKGYYKECVGKKIVQYGGDGQPNAWDTNGKFIKGSKPSFSATITCIGVGAAGAATGFQTVIINIENITGKFDGTKGNGNYGRMYIQFKNPDDQMSSDPEDMNTVEITNGAGGPAQALSLTLYMKQDDISPAYINAGAAVVAAPVSMYSRPTAAGKADGSVQCTCGAAGCGWNKTPASTHSGKKLSGGAIAGIVIGSICGVALIVGCVIFLTKKKKSLGRKSIEYTLH